MHETTVERPPTSPWLLLRHGVLRFLLCASVLLPIYLTYLWIWIKQSKFGKRTPKERRREIHLKNARKFYRLAVKMKGGMIKVGQIISARVDIMPKAWTETLAGLQDTVDPNPWSYIRKRLKEAYGREPEEHFAWINEQALAAASFGQVHRATLHDGTQVALKIKHPDIELKLEVDMILFGLATHLLNPFIKADLRIIYREIRAALEKELDYKQEAEYQEIIRKNLKDFEHVVVPRVISDYSDQNVICTEFFEGYKITNFEKMKELGLERRAMLEIILNVWSKMTYKDGVFQSDPHPGNLLFNVDKNGEPVICILDFGQVKIISKEFHQQLLQLVFAFLARSTDQFLGQLVNMGIMSPEDAEHAKPLLKDFFEKYFDLSPREARKLDFRQIREDVQEAVSKIEGINIPTDMVLYGRTFSLLSGLATQIDPTANGFNLAKPFVMQQLATMAPPAPPSKGMQAAPGSDSGEAAAG